MLIKTVVGFSTCWSAKASMESRPSAVSLKIWLGEIQKLALQDNNCAIQQFSTYQLLLKVDGPYNCIVTHCQNEEEEEAQLSITHLPNASIVEDRLPPVRQPINQDVIIAASVVRNYC